MNYILMNKNNPILKCEIDNENNISKIMEIYEEKYLPYGIKPLLKDLNKWWNMRAIPDTRIGIKNALHQMDLEKESELVVKNLGLSLTDQYWIQPEKSSNKWKEINYFENEFSEYVGDQLLGKEIIEEEFDLNSPCNTVSGNLRKKWTIINDERFLIKGASGIGQEPYNEVIATELHKKMEMFSFTEYKLLEDNDIYSICKNFVTKDTELVSAYQLLNYKSDNSQSYYDFMIHQGEKLGINNIKSYLEYMIATDYIIGNEDRHYNNFGFIRNVNTLEFEGIAPIYDNGNSLWFNTRTASINISGEIKCFPFKKNHTEQLTLVENLKNMDFKKIKDLPDQFNEILKGSEYIDDKRRTVLVKGLEHRYERIVEHQNQQIKSTSILVEDYKNMVKDEIKKNGFKASETVVNNMMKLNKLMGKEHTLQEVSEKFKNSTFTNDKEKYLIKAIGDELKKQEGIVSKLIELER